MFQPIAPIQHVPPAAPAQPAGAAAKTADFRKFLENAMHQVTAAQQEAHQTVEQFLAGEGGEVHTMVLATQRAELSFEMFMQVRNKVVQAYQEIMRMQV